MNIKISTTNSKLGLIPSINLPPIITCRNNCPCAKDCYARKGNFRFKNVKDSLNNNLQVYLKSPDKYFEEIRDYIDNGLIRYSYFRWHASGDIIDELYFKHMVNTANLLNGTKFLAFTKKYEIINDYISNGGQIPDNLNIVFSAWGNEIVFNNPYSFPVAHVRFGDAIKNTSIPSDSTECNGDCTNCLVCWNIGKGQSVVFNKH